MCVCKAGILDHSSDDDSVNQHVVFSSFFQAKAQHGWLVVGTVGCPGPEISQSSKVPITSCLDFVWDRPTLLVLGR